MSAATFAGVTGWIVLAAGLGMLLVVLYDFISTALTVTGGGPVTGRLNASLWRLMKRAHRAHPSHRALSCAGPTLALSSLLCWAAGLWIGWTLVFCASPEAVVDAESEHPANLLSRAYYVGYTLTTLGMGDYKPGDDRWRIVTVLTAANGLFLFTMAITYIIPVLSAVADKRRLAACIHGLGETPSEIIRRAWHDGGFASLESHLTPLAPMLTSIAQQHLAYPILHYFHSPEPTTALPVQLAKLDEALSLLEHGVTPPVRPPALTLRPLRHALRGFITILEQAYIRPAETPPPTPDLSPLRRAGVPTRELQAFGQALETCAEHRRRLLGLVRADAWDWARVVPSGPEGQA